MFVERILLRVGGLSTNPFAGRLYCAVCKWAADAFPRFRENLSSLTARPKIIAQIIAENRMVAEDARTPGYIAKHTLSRWRHMRTSKNSVPLIPLKDFGPSPFLEHGIFIEAFEDCVSVRHKRMEVHRHDYVELFWLHGGGSVLIDFENYPLSGKSLIAIGPGRVHAWHVKQLTGLYISFTQEFFDETRPPPSALFDYPFIFGGEVSPVVRLKPKQGAQAQNLFREISQEFQKHENLAVEMIHHQLRSLMVHLARLYAVTSPAPFAAIGLVRRFHQAVERSFRTSKSVREYAQMLGVTTGHLTESLRLETGLTAGELIRARLLLEGKRLLLHSELTVAEIGYELGFEDPSYFSRFVRREIETSPVELRNRLREKYRKFME